jgi:hypothetical protein
MDMHTTKRPPCQPPHQIWCFKFLCALPDVYNPCVLGCAPPWHACRQQVSREATLPWLLVWVCVCKSPGGCAKLAEVACLSSWGCSLVCGVVAGQVPPASSPPPSVKVTEICTFCTCTCLHGVHGMAVPPGLLHTRLPTNSSASKPCWQPCQWA